MLILAGIRLLRILISIRYAIQVAEAIKGVDDLDKEMLHHGDNSDSNGSSHNDLNSSSSNSINDNKTRKKLIDTRHMLVYDCLCGLCSLSLVCFMDFSMLERMFSWFPGFHHIKAVALLLVAFPELGIAQLLIHDIFTPMFGLIERQFGLPNYPITICSVILYLPVVIAVLIYPGLVYDVPGNINKDSSASSEINLNFNLESTISGDVLALSDDIAVYSEQDDLVATANELERMLTSDARDLRNTSDTDAVTKSSRIIQKGLETTSRRLSNLSKVIHETELLVFDELESESSSILQQIAADTVDVIGCPENSIGPDEVDESHQDRDSSSSSSDMGVMSLNASEVSISSNCSVGENTISNIVISNNDINITNSSVSSNSNSISYSNSNSNSSSNNNDFLPDELGPLDIACNPDFDFSSHSPPKKPVRRKKPDGNAGNLSSSNNDSFQSDGNNGNNNNSNSNSSNDDNIRIEIDRKMSSSRRLTLSIVQSLLVDDINSEGDVVTRSNISKSVSYNTGAFKQPTSASDVHHFKSTALPSRSGKSEGEKISYFRSSFFSFRGGDGTSKSAPLSGNTFTQFADSNLDSTKGSATYSKKHSKSATESKISNFAGVHDNNSNINSNINSSNKISSSINSNSSNKKEENSTAHTLPVANTLASNSSISNSKSPNMSKTHTDASHLYHTSQASLDAPSMSSEKENVDDSDELNDVIKIERTSTSSRNFYNSSSTNLLRSPETVKLIDSSDLFGNSRSHSLKVPSPSSSLLSPTASSESKNKNKSGISGILQSIKVSVGLKSGDKCRSSSSSSSSS